MASMNTSESATLSRFHSTSRRSFIEETSRPAVEEIRIRDFVPDDMTLLNPWPGQGPIMRPADSGLISYTIESDGKPIACGGVQLVWDHVGYAWIALSSTARDSHRFCVARHALRAIDEAHVDFGLFRMNAYVDESNGDAIKFASALGFAIEGRAERFGPGAYGTYLLMGRTW